jgi:hypothetical protein
MIDEMIKDAVKEVVITETTSELGPIIVVGFLTLVMFVGYHICNRIEESASKIRNKRKVAKNV